jgi:hypothetical protein
MSGGGLIQLVAQGPQDTYLTANPQVTYFKDIYRKHTNFALESIEQTFNGQVDFGSRVQCIISRDGDLLSRLYLEVTLPSVNIGQILGQIAVTDADASTFQWVDHIGHALINYVELEIGGQIIDKQYGDWMYIWNELTLPVSKRGALDVMVGSDIRLCSNSINATSNLCSTCTSFTSYDTLITPGLNACAPSFRGANNPLRFTQVVSCLPEVNLYIPLEFWFCRHQGMALPLLALQYHEVKINLQLTNLNLLCNIVSPTNQAAKIFDYVSTQGLVEASFWADFIFLDTEERRRFAQVKHEYLIEQVQFTGAESVTGSLNNIKLSFNHPVKELVWVTQLDKWVDCQYGSTGSMNQPFNYSDDTSENPTISAKLQFNGQDRFDSRNGVYFNFVQPYQHHTNSPAVGINVYSFALKPEDHQPSGTCNFSRITTSTLNLTLTPSTFVDYTTNAILTAKVRIYAVNYNVLSIVSGMGGLVYSN